MMSDERDRYEKSALQLAQANILALTDPRNIQYLEENQFHRQQQQPPPHHRRHTMMQFPSTGYPSPVSVAEIGCCRLSSSQSSRQLQHETLGHEYTTEVHSNLTDTHHSSLLSPQSSTTQRSQFHSDGRVATVEAELVAVLDSPHAPGLLPTTTTPTAASKFSPTPFTGWPPPATTGTMNDVEDTFQHLSHSPPTVLMALMENINRAVDHAVHQALHQALRGVNEADWPDQPQQRRQTSIGTTASPTSRSGSARSLNVDGSGIASLEHIPFLRRVGLDPPESLPIKSPSTIRDGWKQPDPPKNDDTNQEPESAKNSPSLPTPPPQASPPPPPPSPPSRPCKPDPPAHNSLMNPRFLSTEPIEVSPFVVRGHQIKVDLVRRVSCPVACEESAPSVYCPPRFRRSSTFDPPAFVWGGQKESNHVVEESVPPIQQVQRPDPPMRNHCRKGDRSSTPTEGTSTGLNPSQDSMGASTDSVSFRTTNNKQEKYQSPVPRRNETDRADAGDTAVENSKPIRIDIGLVLDESSMLTDDFSSCTMNVEQLKCSDPVGEQSKTDNVEYARTVKEKSSPIFAGFALDESSHGKENQGDEEKGDRDTVLSNNRDESDGDHESEFDSVSLNSGSSEDESTTDSSSEEKRDLPSRDCLRSRLGTGIGAFRMPGCCRYDSSSSEESSESCEVDEHADGSDGDDLVTDTPTPVDAVIAQVVTVQAELVDETQEDFARLMRQISVDIRNVIKYQTDKDDRKPKFSLKRVCSSLYQCVFGRRRLENDNNEAS